MSISCSIYIPRMSIVHTEESVAYYMSQHGIGHVIYVDFTPINKRPGFGENVDQVVKSAFVHFSDPYLGSDNMYHFKDTSSLRISVVPNTVTFWNSTALWNCISSGKSYRLKISQNEYWICLRNNKPVQRTMMNIHQVVENARHLEWLIDVKEKTIQEQAEKINTLERKVEGIQQVVYQLIGGLYCKQSQQGISILHQQVLGGIFAPHIGPPLKNTHKWGFQPTTRQGDDCERRIERLEKIIDDNETQDNELLLRKQTKLSCDTQRIDQLEERLDILLSDLDTYDILKYSNS